MRTDAFASQEQVQEALTQLMHLNEYISIGHLVVHITFQSASVR